MKKIESILKTICYFLIYSASVIVLIVLGLLCISPIIASVVYLDLMNWPSVNILIHLIGYIIGITVILGLLYMIINSINNYIRYGDNYNEKRETKELFEKLYEWHFDINNLIERGLAIDINTVNE